MKRVFSWGQKNFRWLRQIVTVILVGFAVLSLQAFGYSNAITAQADTAKTPEAKYYNAEPTQNDKKLIDNTKNNFKDVVDNVREKLNLDEPLPRSTKEFLNSTKEKVEDTVEPITGKNQGYYQE